MAEEKKIEKVISGEAHLKKKSILNGYINTDGEKVKDYLVHDILIPGAMALASTFLICAVETIFGKPNSVSRERERDSRRGRTERVSYDRYYDEDRRDRTAAARYSSGRRGGRDFQDAVVDTRWEAEEVVDHMYKILGDYKAVSVADLMDLVGMKHVYTDNDWGWKDLTDVRIRKCSGGYLIDMPRAEALD